MYQTWFAALLISGCAFSAIPGETSDGTEGPDAGAGVSPDDDGGTVPARRCTDPSTRLCVDFESLTPLRDELGATISAVGLRLEPRGAEQAVAVTTSSELRVAETPRLDLATNLTIEMWIKPEPALFVTMGLLHNAGQYALAYQGDGEVRCQLGSDRVESRRPVSPGGWHHVACTLVNGELRLYIDGSLDDCENAPAAIPTSGTGGTVIGAYNLDGSRFAPFVGQLDNVRIHGRAFTPQELCDISGSTTCTATCPTGGGSGPG
ncbi:MAG: LamG domain-containing protein [Myxococcota bacterium]|nr:LamG domain-containing protein [Myxococcota bacterium]